MKKLTTVIMLGLLASGCQTMDPYTGESKTSNTATGTGIGAVAGAVLGAAVSSKKDRGRGALTGALVGGAVGGGIGHYMDNQEAQLRQELEATGVRVQRVGEDAIRLIMPGNITFQLDSDQLQPQFYPTLDSVVKVLTKYDRSLIDVAGYTDSSGSFEYNQQLSERRAYSVADYLVGQGLLATRISSHGFGERYPIADNGSAAGRAANRRVEINIRGQI
ncbi:OmpA family protein [Marinobacterium arenosum]|uniref:OmpA family protein n=1 Tax=Marinobacterium arenosum TaxID=2862496 RepID=UPI001C946CBD|nr:OmpA family protein [Marinobacterium arenosum]MBY4675636.1 OmpA family protein [Marinobacterium arenosum]